MTTALSFDTGRHADGTVVLTASGEIDMSNADAFIAALAEARADAAGDPFLVDLTGVGYLDSAGLAALFPHVEHLRLVAGPLLAPVLAVAGLDEVTTIRDAS